MSNFLGKQRASHRVFLLLFLTVVVITKAGRLHHTTAKNLHSILCYGERSTVERSPLFLEFSQHCVESGQVSDAIGQGNLNELYALLRPLARSGNNEAFLLLIAANGEIRPDGQASLRWQEDHDLQEILNLAESEVQRGNLTAAYEAYLLAWLLWPVTGAKRLANFLVEEQGEWNAAARIVHQTISSYPEAFTDADKLISLARIHSGNDQLQLAADTYATFILKYPYDERVKAAYYELSGAYYKAGETESALLAIQEALEIDSPYPEDWRVIQRVGQIYEEAGHLEKAIGYYRQVLTINPNASVAANALKRLKFR